MASPDGLEPSACGLGISLYGHVFQRLTPIGPLIDPLPSAVGAGIPRQIGPGFRAASAAEQATPAGREMGAGGAGGKAGGCLGWVDLGSGGGWAVRKWGPVDAGWAQDRMT